jgi:hypothetical protein
VSEHDPVNHPRHYTSSDAKCSACGAGIECIQVVEHMPFSLGNAVKYLWRAGLKGDLVEDLKKARWYIDREIARRAREHAAPPPPAASEARITGGEVPC